MEFFSLVLIGWSWLEIGVVSKRELIISSSSDDSSFYESKLDTLEYFYAYELPKTKGLAEHIFCLKLDLHWFQYNFE